MPSKEKEQKLGRLFFLRQLTNSRLPIQQCYTSAHTNLSNLALFFRLESWTHVSQ